MSSAEEAAACRTTRGPEPAHFSSDLLYGVLYTMTGAITAIIAVLGTLLGAALTYVFQRKVSDRAALVAFQQQLRSERLITYSDFAGAVKEFQRGQDNRWFRTKEDPDGSVAFAARMEVYQLSSTAHHALFRVQLVTDTGGADGEELVKAAQYAFQQTADLHHASTESELGALADAAGNALENFIKLAARIVLQNPADGGLPGL